MNRKNKRSVFITGASGFLGANIARAFLKKNYSVHILNRTKNISWRLKDIEKILKIHRGDVTNSKSLHAALHKSKPDYIIHLATYGAYHFQTESKKIVNTNIVGTLNLLEASKDIPYKCFINTGSSSEYGYKNTSMKEKDYCDPESFYAATKLSAANICKVFAKLNNKPIVTLRLFSVYGPYEEKTRLIPTIIKSLILNEEIKLTKGNVRRDFIYIEDVINAYFLAIKYAKKIRGEIFNIGTGYEYTNSEVVQKLFKVTNKKTHVLKNSYPKRGWDTSHWKADISYTKKQINWKPMFTIDMGLKTAYSWFEKNIKYYQ